MARIPVPGAAGAAGARRSPVGLRRTLAAACSCGRHGLEPVPRASAAEHAAGALAAHPGVWSGVGQEFFDDYRQLRDVVRFIDRLQADHPELVVVRTIGSSWQGRPLRILEVTNRSAGLPLAEDKPCIFLEGGIHAREWIATSTVLFIAEALVKQAGSPTVAALLREYVVTLLAPVNPDGYVHSWEKHRMWRKTRSNRSTAECRSTDDGIGVDPNRNWGYTWGQTREQGYRSSLHNPCSDVYIGPAAFSEPEVRAVAEYMAGRQKRSLSLRGPGGTPGPGYVAAFLDFHSFAQVLLPPWAYIAEQPDPPDGNYQKGLTDVMVQAIKACSGRTFKAGADAFPADPGTGPDWAYGELGVRATMTVELEGVRGSGSSFCLPRTFIREVGNEQFQAVLGLVEYLRVQGNVPSQLVGLYAAATTKEQGKWSLRAGSPLTAATASVPTGAGLAGLGGSVVIPLSVMAFSVGGFFLHRQWRHSGGTTRCPAPTTLGAGAWE